MGSRDVPVRSVRGGDQIGPLGRHYAAAAVSVLQRRFDELQIYEFSDSYQERSWCSTGATLLPRSQSSAR